MKFSRLQAVAMAAMMGACAPSDGERASTANARAGREAQPARLGSEARPDVLLITVDTLRPDSLGWAGGAHPTPALDALAISGVAFPAAVAPVPLTLPSHASMFSGLLPRRHGVRDNHQVVGSRPPLLAQRLADAGYDTAAVVSGFPLTAGFGLDRGFAGFDDELTTGEGAWLERPAAETAAVAGGRLTELRSPWFLWVHFYDPHFPYEPPAGYERSGRRGAYDGEVAFVDAEAGKLMDAARAASDGELLTVFAADHGEALGEHGEGTHGFFVYDDTLLVPLVFHWPGRLGPAIREEAARLVDLAPTVLDLLALEPFTEIDGVSLLPLLEGGPGDPPAAYLETLQPWNSYGWSPLAAVRHQGWKLIAAPRPELYDLQADPDESENLFDRERERARGLQRLLREVEALPAIAAEAVEDPETLEQLRALGYLGTSSSAEIPPRSTLRDPKDQVELRELLTRADRELRAQRYEETARLCRQALGQDPQNRFARLRLGLALQGAGDLESAAGELGRAVASSPSDPEARAAYGEALMRAGEPEQAVQQWLEVVRLQPRQAKAWSNLGASLGLSGQPRRAVAAFEKAVALEPGDPERWTRLGFAAFAAGDLPRAANSLERAAGLTPGAPFPHAGALGLVLDRLGRYAEAIAWLERSLPAEGDFARARIVLVRRVLETGDPPTARRLLRDGIRERPELRALAQQDELLSGLLDGR